MFNKQTPNLYPVSGNPNGLLAGNAAGALGTSAPPDLAWDGSNIWVCTQTGTKTTAVWSPQTMENITTPSLNLGTISTGTVNVDRSKGVVQSLTAGGPISIALASFLPGYSEILLELTNGGSTTITWPLTVNWVTSTGAVTNSFSSYGIQLQTGGTDFIVFWSSDGGATIYGKIIR